MSGRGSEGPGRSGRPARRLRSLVWARVALVAVLWIAPVVISALGDRNRFLDVDLTGLGLPYLVIGVLVTLDALVPILPSESLLTTASGIAAQPDSDLAFGPILLAGAAGAVAGDSLLYWVARTLGRRSIAEPLERALKDPRVAPAWEVFGESTPLLIIGGRFVPGPRFVVNAAMGLRGYPYPRFLALSALGGVLWATFTCRLSYGLGEWLSGSPVLSILLLVVVSGGIVFGMVMVLGRRYLRRRGGQADAGPATASPGG